MLGFFSFSPNARLYLSIFYSIFTSKNCCIKDKVIFVSFLVFVLSIIASTGRVGNVLVALRCVEIRDKAISMAFQVSIGHSLKGLGHQMSFVWRTCKIKSILYVHAPLVFKFFGHLFKDKNKYFICYKRLKAFILVCTSLKVLSSEMDQAESRLIR
jgi:hypothetical protein